jgi:ATP-dependent protease HslVU (ClpYQ) peptidase subunit
LESIAEKREFLEKKRAQLVKELEEIAADNEEERLRKLIEMADLENEYTRLKDNSRKSDFTTPAADQLAKIGGGGNVALTGGFDLLSENRRQTDYLKSIDAQLRKGGTLAMR